jgi:hypothetical protein
MHEIDGVRTGISRIRHGVAEGFIINTDLTLSPCFVAKVNGCFAHGETASEAMRDANSKAFGLLPIEDRISAFLGQFSASGKYTAAQLSEWHGRLTGSCSMGRQSFMNNRGINPSDKLTLNEFLTLADNQYGYDVINQIQEAING